MILEHCALHWKSGFGGVTQFWCEIIPFNIHRNNNIGLPRKRDPPTKAPRLSMEDFAKYETLRRTENVYRRRDDFILPFYKFATSLLRFFTWHNDQLWNGSISDTICDTSSQCYRQPRTIQGPSFPLKILQYVRIFFQCQNAREDF